MFTAKEPRLLAGARLLFCQYVTKMTAFAGLLKPRAKSFTSIKRSGTEFEETFLL
jgi:hypothetical protein